MTQVRQNFKGSMLIDLLVVLGIIALLSTIAIPYIREYQPNLKLRGTARNLTSDLRYAQQLTVTQQKVHLVYFDVANKKYLIQRLDTATTTVKTINFDPDISYQQITGLNNNYVYYNFYGGVSQPGEIILKNINNFTSTINIKASGYVELR